jgi:hypothetical protein
MLLLLLLLLLRWLLLWLGPRLLLGWGRLRLLLLLLLPCRLALAAVHEVLPAVRWVSGGA